jgi:hypothetical protein
MCDSRVWFVPLRSTWSAVELDDDGETFGQEIDAVVVTRNPDGSVSVNGVEPETGRIVRLPDDAVFRGDGDADDDVRRLAVAVAAAWTVD